MQEDLEKVLFREPEIAKRLDELAARITEDYRGKDLTVLAILNGSLIFMADLLRRIPLPIQLDCLRVRSYHGGTVTTGKVEFDRSALPDLKGRHVLLLDDILDSGHTLAAIEEAIRIEGRPLSVKSCVLLRKLKERAIPVEADYIGFDVPDQFVVGYGLDYQERYRNLPLIGVLKRQESGARSQEPGVSRMKVSLQYFAQLRDLGGPEVIELPEGSTVGTLLQKVFELQPKLKAWDRQIRVAAGTDWVSRDHVIAPGESISLMPPVQGG